MSQLPSGCRRRATSGEKTQTGRKGARLKSVWPFSVLNGRQLNVCNLPSQEDAADSCTLLLEGVSRKQKNEPSQSTIIEQHREAQPDTDGGVRRTWSPDPACPTDRRIHVSLDNGSWSDADPVLRIAGS